MLIEKNGTQSLMNLALSNSTQFKIVSVEHLKKNNINKITVFVRDPINRVISGLNTQIKLLGIPKQELDNLINQRNIFNIYDSHTMPQFWFLLKLSTILDVEFQIKSIKDLAYVNARIKNIRIPYADEFHITSPVMLDRLVHFYTEDEVLYNQFLNTTCSIELIIEKIKLETNFINDLQQYRQVLTYLL